MEKWEICSHRKKFVKSTVWFFFIFRNAPRLSLPGKLVFPSTHNSGHFSMLGLGDIVMPGLLLCFVMRYDAYKRAQVCLNLVTIFCLISRNFILFLIFRPKKWLRLVFLSLTIGEEFHIFTVHYWDISWVYSQPLFLVK